MEYEIGIFEFISRTHAHIFVSFYFDFFAFSLLLFHGSYFWWMEFSGSNASNNIKWYKRYKNTYTQTRRHREKENGLRNEEEKLPNKMR